MKFRTRRWWGLALTASLVVAACGESGTDPDTDIREPGQIQETPEVGQSDFVSADGRNGEGSQDNTDGNNAATPEAGEADAAADDRTVEEGDIFRVASTADHIYNLNSYRGFQVLDFSDTANPSIIGNARLAGYPVEMYQVGDKVYALMNNWRGYYGTRSDLVPTAYEGGVVVTIDIADPTKPEVVDHDQVPGYIRTSRLTRGNGQEALFVAAADYDGTTYVKSFSVGNGGDITPASEIQLAGNVSDIQATPERLIVARWDWRAQSQGSEVSLIDITDPAGQMVEGDTIRVKGRVANKFNMDVHNDVLRVVSGNSWDSNTNTNWVQTYDASDIQNLALLDEDSFGDNEDLFATLFLGNSAFFVTYRRVDPFHAYEVLDDGTVTEMSEFIVSGWNDYFRPVENQTRLVGIGKNDENGGNTMAVSLYDITDLSNPNPLIDRKEIDLDWSWSEASWDDRAFTVLEKGTVAQAEDGTIETGLVLLPFSGYDDQQERYISAVQIFTFSDTTITKRGIMDHGTRVRRSFVADAGNNTTGNLSEEELSLFDTYDTDNPVELGRVELAPNFTELFTYGNHAVRRQNRNGWYYWWGYNDSSYRKDHLEIVSTAGSIDRIESLHTIEIPASSVVEKVAQNKLMVAYSDVVDANTQTYETTIDLYDLTIPTNPTKVDTLTTTDLPPIYGNGYYYGYWGDCWDCGGYYSSANLQIVGDAIVFAEPVSERELEGTIHARYQRPKNNWYETCYDPNTGDRTDSCTWLSGGITCRQLVRVDGSREDEVCYGEFQRCTSTDNDTTCNPVTPDASEIQTNTNSYESHRYWTHYNLDVIDTTAGNLRVAPSHDMATNEEAVGMVARGDSLYLSFKKPFQLPGDSRPYVKYYFRELDLSAPSMAQIGPDVNVPGQLVEVEGDTVVTRDYLWGSQIIESSLNRLEVKNGRATLTAPPQRLVDQQVYQIQLDGAGHVLVTHRAAWRVQTSGDELTKLTMYDLDAATFDRLDTFELDRWANLRDAIGGRALFSVPGGLLVVNTSNPNAPFAQAYFPVNGWPRAFVLDGRDVHMASGRYGIYSFGLDTFNLLSQSN